MGKKREPGRGDKPRPNADARPPRESAVKAGRRRPRESEPEDDIDQDEGTEEESPRGRRLSKSNNAPLLAIGVVAVLLVIAGIAYFALSRPADSIPDNEAQAVQTLKAIAAGQTKYAAAHANHFSVNGAQLVTADGPVTDKIAAAFRDNVQNGDPPAGSSVSGYEFMMLMGEHSGLKLSFLVKPPDWSQGMEHWACIARPVRPGKTGKHQFLIAETGAIYQQEDTDSLGFRLDFMPAADGLKQNGWAPGP